MGAGERPFDEEQPKQTGELTDLLVDAGQNTVKFDAEFPMHNYEIRLEARITKRQREADLTFTDTDDNSQEKSQIRESNPRR